MQKLMYIAAALLVLVGCNNKEEINGTQNPPAQIVTITGGIDFSSQVGARKVAAKDGWENVAIGDKVYFTWEAGDEIKVMSMEEETDFKKFTVTSISEDGQTAVFAGEALASGMDEYLVIYPYDADFEVMGPWHLNQKYDGKLRPAAAGAGEGGDFMLSKFTPIYDLSLTGDIKLGKIEYWDSEECAAAISMPEGGLQLNGTPQHVTMTIGSDVAEITFRFYDIENNMIMEKNCIPPTIDRKKYSPIISLPTLEVTASTPTVDPKDVFNEGAIMCLSLYFDGRSYKFTYQYNKGAFNVVEILEKGIDVTSEYKDVCPVTKDGAYSFLFEMGIHSMKFDAENRTYEFFGSKLKYMEVADFQIDGVSILNQLKDITKK